MIEVHQKYNLPCLATENPYLQKGHQPADTEWTADTDSLTVIGEIPKDLNGVYLRNGHNQIHEPMGKYHPFDGDGMVHGMHFCNGKATYRNRFIRTTGFLAEQAAGESLWPGIIEPRLAVRRGWGSIGAMKDNAGTDVKVHAGRAIAAMSQCSEPYRLDPITIETLGPDASWGRALGDRGICSHFQIDEHTQQMMFFNFGEHAPYFNYGVVNAKNELIHYEPIELPHATWPHDMGMSEQYCVIHDLSMFFDPAALKQGQHRLKFHRDRPARFGVIPRMGSSQDIRWFEGQPCYILHLANTYEVGDEIIMDGAIQTNPVPDLSALPREGYARMNALLSMDLQETRMHRWRFNLKTGETHEQDLDDEVTEFSMINGRYKGRSNRYVYNAIMQPNWELVGLKKYDWLTGQSQRWEAPAGCFVSETPFAPRDGSQAEDDGYLVTFITNLNTGKGECAIFDARDITRGPICQIVLPGHVPMGAHAGWTPASAL